MGMIKAKGYRGDLHSKTYKTTKKPKYYFDFYDFLPGLLFARLLHRYDCNNPEGMEVLSIWFCDGEEREYHLINARAKSTEEMKKTFLQFALEIRDEYGLISEKTYKTVVEGILASHTLGDIVRSFEKVFGGYYND